ncbi:uncharacterized protein [Anoplolepis gracilipes]|uniref:uncharacterized protein n=1 Tax=Anoplolepis gracilipes TaxID=354296 RepID=UPI003BA33E49
MYRVGKNIRGYRSNADINENGGPRAPPNSRLVRRVLRTQRNQLQQQKINEWQESLVRARAGLYAVGTLGPILDRWVGRKHGSLGYRLVQMLTEHGCFGEYLHRIRREESGRCHHCNSPEDTARHTLEECSAWANERRTLRDVIGNDVSLPVLLNVMLEGDVKWQAAVSFCERVMLQKEAAEREREKALDALERRRRRDGRACCNYDRRAQP